jgi:hypothetical protein
MYRQTQERDRMLWLSLFFLTYKRWYNKKKLQYAHACY